jgi:RNA polymerase sigma factor for flagellar operon FliA
MRNQREELILKHLDLVKRVARSLARKLDADAEEFEADGMVGLIEAAKRYKPAKNSNFPAYAMKRIRGSIIDGYRKIDRLGRTERDLRKKNPKRIEETKHIYHEHQADLTPHGWEKVLNESADQIVILERKFLRDLINILPFKLKVMMKMYYIEQKTYTEIGNEYGFSASRVCQLHTQAIGIIRQHLRKRDLLSNQK